MSSKAASTPELEDEPGACMPCGTCGLVDAICEPCAADIEAAYWRCVKQSDLFAEERDG